MWTRLQIRLPIIIGIVMLCAHSLLVTGLLRVSLENIEFGVMWEHMYQIDRPMSLFEESFFDAYSKVFGETADDTYHKKFFLFHLIFGGFQYFVCGCLLGVVVKTLRKRERFQESDNS